MELRDVLKMIRAELGINQAEFANALHVSYATVNRWETGKTYPNRSILAALSEFSETHSLSKVCRENLKNAIADANRTKIAKAKEKLYSVEHASLRQLIDDASFMIYVCDIETDELLYVNHKTEELRGGDFDRLVGEKCYKCLMDRDSPCDFCHKEALVTQRFTTYQAFRPGENTYHLVQGKLIQWNGSRAQVRYIVDIGNSFTVADRDSRMTAYSEQLLVRSRLAGDVIAAAHYNLTQNTVMSIASDDTDLKNMLAKYSVDELLIMIRENDFSQEEQDKLEEIGDRGRLIQQFFAGNKHIAIKHYIKSRNGYFEGTFDLLQNPMTFDIEAFAQLHDITRETMMEEISRRIINMDYESISVIDAKSGEAHPYWGAHINDVIALQREMGDYVGGVEAYLRKNCADDDVERVIRQTSLPYVKERLETQLVYRTTYLLRQGDKVIRKRVIYTYLDMRKTTLLCTMQNVTEMFAPEGM